ncbi:hypothetical protein G6L37_07515 [Agrobacterium rubi]|nr:hypothetical protein [Agrobacterium rubi]NTF25216.1 hypothetical protein [Agrobacterium rubi]
MTDEIFDLDRYLESKGGLEYDLEQARGFVTLVPGSPDKDKVSGIDERDILFPDLLVTDLLHDDAPYDAYPFFGPTTFGWNNGTPTKHAKVAATILGGRLRYDEYHELAGAGSDFDYMWSRTMVWYLVKNLAGDVEIEVRLRTPKDYDSERRSKGAFVTINIDDILNPDFKSLVATRNAYMSNFNVIGCKIIRQHQPDTLPSINAFQSQLAPEAWKFLKACRRYISVSPYFELWTSHYSWLCTFFAFARSTEEQRAVLYHQLSTGSNPLKAPLSLGENIIGRSYVDPLRGPVSKRIYVAEPILDMLSRGFLTLDAESRTVSITEHGRSLHNAFTPVEQDFRLYDFVSLSDEGLSISNLIGAKEWLLSFFEKLKLIADAAAQTKD